MRIITIDEVRALGPCYTNEQILDITGGRTEMPLIEVCDLAAPRTDLLWLLLREDFLPPEALHTLACDFAGHALMREREHGREPDARSWEVIETKRRWIRNEASDEDLAAAWSAAWAAVADAAARSAAWSAARSAAWSALNAAAKFAARSAAMSAAMSAATSAVWYSANDRVAEEEWQLAQVRSAIETAVSTPEEPHARTEYPLAV